MINEVAARSSVEMSDAPAFARRTRRLVLVSLVALGTIWVLAVAGLDAPTWVVVLLGAGWLLMPAVLAASVDRPGLRYLLAVPATLVSTGLLAILLLGLPSSATATAGWSLIAAGVLLGAGLGGWFWYRLLPVPPALDPPFSPGRWALVSVHAGLVTAGLILVLVG